MTNTPHGQVPEALRLAEILEGDYCPDWFYEQGVDEVAAELRRQHTRIAELEAQIEALSGVQALSAAPAVAKLRHLYQNMVNGAVRDTASAKRIAEGLLAPAIEALERATPPAEQQAAPKAAPEVGNSGFDYKTAADFLNGKTVSDEAVRKFVAASRWAHDERAALSATLLAMHGVLTSREAEIALLKKALLEAEAAPQQEAQEPVMIYHGRCTIDCGEGGHHDMEMLRLIPKGSKLYTAPQQAPAPLSERDAFERDWEKRHAPVPINGRTHDDDGRYGDSSIQDAWESWQARAALAAQGGKDA